MHKDKGRERRKVKEREREIEEPFQFFIWKCLQAKCQILETVKPTFGLCRSYRTEQRPLMKSFWDLDKLITFIEG